MRKLSHNHHSHHIQLKLQLFEHQKLVYQGLFEHILSPYENDHTFELKPERSVIICFHGFISTGHIIPYYLFHAVNNVNYSIDKLLGMYGEMIYFQWGGNSQNCFFLPF